MAKQTLSNLRSRAQAIKDAQTLGVNTAAIVGGLFLDILDSAYFDYDNSRPYAAGEQAVYKARLMTVFQPVAIGESPESAPTKWIDQVIDTIDKLGENGANLPIMASALKPFVAAKVTAAISPGIGSALVAGLTQLVDPNNPADALSTSKVYAAKDFNDLLTAFADNLALSGGGRGPYNLTPSYDYIPGSPTYQDLALILTTDGTVPQIKLKGMGAVEEWKTGVAVAGQAGTFKITFHGVTQSGRFHIRAYSVNSTAPGDSYPLRVAETFIPQLIAMDN